MAEIIAKHAEENKKEEVYKFLLNTVDLTTLSSEDSEKSVAAFVQKVNDFENNYPMYKNVAAICVYSRFAEVVRSVLLRAEPDHGFVRFGDVLPQRAARPHGGAKGAEGTA